MIMEEILTEYYAQNARKLHRLVDRILWKFGGWQDRDKDDFYSLANEVFADVMRRYDGSHPFESFLYVCLVNRVKTEMSRRISRKRLADRLAVSIDTPVCGEEELTLGDLIADPMDIERIVLEEKEEGYSRRMQLYLAKLSRLQGQVLRFRTAGYLPGEIRRELGIDKRQYEDCEAAIHSYRNLSVLL